MPFRKRAKITVTNIGDEQCALAYQINYALAEVPADATYFHAQFRRNNPVPYGQTHVILDGVKGKGHFVGTHMAWGVNNNGWWGEGEIKFYMDGDGEFPTICGTGTEDYFCGSYGFVVDEKIGYIDYTTPYAGFSTIRCNSFWESQQRFSMYRWHITDPVRFEKDLKVDMQALGWRNKCERYLPLQDDVASTAFWYQTEPHAPFPALPSGDYLEII